MIDQIKSEKWAYPEAAYEFVRQGLPYTVRQTHGEPSEEQARLERWLRENGIELDRFEELYEQGALPREVLEFTEAMGGPHALNRHVSGQQVCWGLRDLAIKRWGLLARTVLRKWKVRRTEDFGRIVFALIEEGQLRKQPGDSIDDFKEVFDFEDAFNTSRIFEAQN